MRKLLADNEFYTESCNDCKTVFEFQQGAMEFVINELKSTLK
jgi:hypothetical protein